MREMYLYYPELPPTVEEPLILSDAIHHRLSTVLRITAETQVIFTNGNGLTQRALIYPSTPITKTQDEKPARKDKRSSSKAHTLSAKRIGTPEIAAPPTLNIHYGLALIKGERFEWALQKMTELGVTHITPLMTERTEVKLSGSRRDKKITHWHNEVIAALEQSQRSYLPKISSPMTLPAWLQSLDPINKHRWILSPHDDTSDEAFFSSVPPLRHLIITSGPEGGFSEQEVSNALNHGFKTRQFGPRILRAETAPVVALTLAQWFWGDFQDR